MLGKMKLGASEKASLADVTKVGARRCPVMQVELLVERAFRRNVDNLSGVYVVERSIFHLVVLFSSVPHHPILSLSHSPILQYS